MFSLKVSGYGPWFQTCLQPKYCNQSSPKQKCIYTIFTLQDRWNSKKCIFPKEMLVFAAQILTQKMHIHLGGFLGWQKKVHIHLGGFLGWQKMQKKEFRNAKIGTILVLAFPPQSLSDVYLKSIYLCIFVSFYFSIFLSFYLSIYLSIIYLSIYLWQFDYLLTFDGSKQAVGHQISQNAVNKCICIFVKFWEISSAWWNVTNPICSIPSWMHRLWFLDGSNHQKFQTRSVVFTGFLIEWHNI